MDPSFLSIIIPAHNEETRHPARWGRFSSPEIQPYSSEVIIVENGSSDRTLELALEFTAQHPSLIVIHEEKRGKGNAIQRPVCYRRAANIILFATPTFPCR
ncbi:MAG: glycosyltransferase [Anaerolineales bacterium]|nr:glycosyltransferase [Anaerolineales bacterium]